MSAGTLRIEDVVSAAFRGVLGREPDEESLAVYAEQIRSGVLPLDYLLRYFTSLDEFYMRCSPLDRASAISHLYAGGGGRSSNEDMPQGNAMIWNPSTRRLLFFHFPKTAGMAFTHEVAKHYHPLQIGHMYRRAESPYKIFFSSHMDWETCASVCPPVTRITCLREPKDRLLSLFSFLGILGRNAASPFEAAAALAEANDLEAFLTSDDPKVRNVTDNAYVRQLSSAFVDDSGYDPLAENPEACLQTAWDNLQVFDSVFLFEDIKANGGRLPHHTLAALRPHVADTFDGILRQRNVTPRTPRASAARQADDALFERNTRFDAILYDRIVERDRMMSQLQSSG